MELRKIVADRNIRDEGEVMVVSDGAMMFPTWGEAREIAHRCNVHDELIHVARLIVDQGATPCRSPLDLHQIRTLAANVIAKAKGED